MKHKRQLWWKIPLFLVVEVFILLSLLISYGLLMGSIEISFDATDVLEFDIDGIQYFLFPIFNFQLYATGYYFIRKYIRDQQEIFRVKNEILQEKLQSERLEKNLAQSKQDFLRAQVNPHLLFNTLSFISFSVKNNPESAQEAIGKLSEMMRYALLPNVDGQHIIKLESELTQIRNLIDLHQLRFDNTLAIQFQLPDTLPDCKIPPLSLMTLVENLFKYAELGDQEFPASITLEINNTGLIFTTKNKKKRISSPNKSNQTGLLFLRERLRMTYGTEAKLSIKNNFDYFSASLSIPYL
ncbi:MAG: histidine kinase [Cyclobacteriaceae bacterium]|nr:histidine kinase [Cyclobacteriaceae bacterium]MCH8516889.1 histidine kinase [Cyclobacteriaceae bacterium]